MTQELIPAATVVLLREGLQVFLLKRHSKSSFLADTYVFPGGCVDAKDRDEDWQNYLDDANPCRFVERARARDPHWARQFLVTAIRETWEEAGVCLASPESKVRDLTKQLASLNQQNVDFLTWIKEQNVRLSTSHLIFFDHWITPEVEKKRFDTYFFAAVLPHGQAAYSASQETSQGMWISPAEALRQFDAGQLLLAPPTSTTLMRLARFSHLEAALTYLAHRPVATMLPKMCHMGGKTVLALPGHKAYGDYAGTLEQGGPFEIHIRQGRLVPVFQ